jgi:hypothetical protein
VPINLKPLLQGNLAPLTLESDLNIKVSKFLKQPRNAGSIHSIGVVIMGFIRSYLNFNPVSIFLATGGASLLLSVPVYAASIKFNTWTLGTPTVTRTSDRTLASILR